MSSDELNILDYKFQDLVDVEAFAKVLDNFFEATGIPNGLVAENGEIISQSGWMNACKLFHRVNEQSNNYCLQSNIQLMNSLEDGEIHSSLCKNGLIDYATPIVIEGKRVATLFLGQILEKKPQISYFEQQSDRFNYNKKEYIKSIKEVPIVSKEKMESLMKCMVGMAKILAENGLAKYKHDILEKNLLKSNEEIIHLGDILEFSPNGIGWTNTNGEVEYVNHQFTEIFGYEKNDIPNLKTWFKKVYPDKNKYNILSNWYKNLKNAKENSNIPELEVNIKCKNGTYRHVLITVAIVGEKRLFNFSDITNHWKSEQRNRSHDKILGLVAKGIELTDILEEILKTIEYEDPKSKCSILLLDEEGKHLFNIVRNRLPEFYNNAIDGVEIGVGIGSCGSAAKLGKRVIADDIMTHEYWQPYKKLAKKANLGACWSEPIIGSNGKVLGTFAIYHKLPNKPNEADIERICFAANIAAIAIENRNNRINLEKQAYTDYLTGLNNRRSFIEKTEVELYRKERYGREFSLVMFDIDHFKLINDKYGHNIGDLVLKEIANICRMVLREIDIIGRIGGEEFAILLPETSIKEATQVAQRLRMAIEKANVASNSNEKIKFTASFGVTVTNNSNLTINELLNQADTALYIAKNSGRNKVVVKED